MVEPIRGADGKDWSTNGPNGRRTDTTDFQTAPGGRTVRIRWELWAARVIECFDAGREAIWKLYCLSRSEHDGQIAELNRTHSGLLVPERGEAPVVVIAGTP